MIIRSWWALNNHTQLVMWFSLFFIGIAWDLKHAAALSGFIANLVSPHHPSVPAAGEESTLCSQFPLHGGYSSQELLRDCGYSGSLTSRMGVSRGLYQHLWASGWPHPEEVVSHAAASGNLGILTEKGLSPGRGSSRRWQRLEWSDRF